MLFDSLLPSGGILKVMITLLNVVKLYKEFVHFKGHILSHKVALALAYCI